MCPLCNICTITITYVQHSHHLWPTSTMCIRHLNTSARDWLIVDPNERWPRVFVGTIPCQCVCIFHSDWVARRRPDNRDVNAWQRPESDCAQQFVCIHVIISQSHYCLRTLCDHKMVTRWSQSDCRVVAKWSFWLHASNPLRTSLWPKWLHRDWRPSLVSQGAHKEIIRRWKGLSKGVAK